MSKLVTKEQLLEAAERTASEIGKLIEAVTSALNGKADSSHNQASNTINAMTGYSKPSSTGAISTSDSLNTAIGKLEKALDGKQASGSYAAKSHNQASNTINAMTGYSKASSASAISTSDSLNTAIGKLEKGLDGKLGTDAKAASATTADTATKLATARTIDGVPFDGSAAITHYCTCSTGASTAAKTASFTGFSLVTGARISVKFTYTNSNSAPTLNVNSTGAKQMYWNGVRITNQGVLLAGGIYDFVYDGSYWQLIGATRRLATIMTLPTQSNSLTYTGGELEPMWNDYDSTQLTIGGTTKGTNAGTYSATFTPTANYQWADDTTAAKTANWTISKAAGSMSLNKSSLSLSASSLTGTVTVTRAGNGTITATSSNPNVATASVSGTTVTVTGVGSGSATITISVAEGTNHLAPSSKTVSVDVTLISENLNDNNPAQIKAAAQSGQAAAMWSVGDTIDIALDGTVAGTAIKGTYKAVILGFNHNSSYEGNNTIHFQIGQDSGGTNIAFQCSTSRMNSSNTNSGGWASSEMRNTWCKQFLNAMPSSWQSAIKSQTKYTDNTGNSSNTSSGVTNTTDKIWLLSEFEVFGKRSSANQYEKDKQAQYTYYANGNPKIRYKHTSLTSAVTWWLRSPKYSLTTFFCVVDTDGTVNHGIADDVRGLALGFSIG